MRPSQLFPSAVGHLDLPTDVDVDLSEPDAVARLLAHLRGRQDALDATPHLGEQFTRALLADVRDLADVDPSVPEAARVVMALGVCWSPARLAFEQAQPLEAWLWLHRAVATSDDDGGAVDIDLGPLDRSLRDPGWTTSVQRGVILLAPMVFYLANNHSTAEQLAQGLHPAVLAICTRCLSTGDVHVVDAAVHLVKYLVWNDLRAQACALGHALETLLFNHPDHPMAGALAALLSGEQPPITHRDPADIAAWAVQHVSMSVFAALSLEVTAFLRLPDEDRHAAFPGLLQHLEKVVARVEDEDEPLQVSRDRGVVFSMLGPLQFQLLNTGDTTQLLQLLSTWRGVPVAQARTDQCVVLANAGSRAWYRPGTAPSPDDPASLARLTTAFNRALGRSLVTRGLNDTTLTTPASGMKDHSHAGELEAALRAHLDVEDLADFTRRRGADAYLSLLPSLTPLQGLLARAGGPVLPLTVSLGQPLPDRPVERVQLWCADAPSARAEAAILQTVFPNAGITVDLIAGQDLTRDRFLAEYQRDHYDAIWVIAHGSHPPLAPDRSAIVLNDTERVFLDDLARTPRPAASSRRLLVLNTCDSAGADTQGPYDDRGLARSVTGPDQAVVGHLWPVDGAAATVFGSLLAIELADGSTYAEAFASAMRDLQQDWPSLAAQLGDRGIGSLVAEPLDHFRDATIFDWGSAAFLE